MDIGEVLGKVTAQVPDSLSGVERQRLVGQLVVDLPGEEGDLLRETVNGLLAQMEEKDA